MHDLNELVDIRFDIPGRSEPIHAIGIPRQRALHWIVTRALDDGWEGCILERDVPEEVSWEDQVSASDMRAQPEWDL